MRLSVSNIAWEPAEDEAVAALLRQSGIDAIDIAPGKCFAKPAEATAVEIAAVREAWAARGIAIRGMQGLLFGSANLNMFGSAQTQSAMLAYLGEICRVAAGLGATRLVFGAPKHRDRGTLSDAQADAVARDFFLRLGDIAADRGVVFCIEAVPATYGSNFLRTHAEAAAMVRAVDHPSIRLLLDSGTIAANGEDCAQVVRDHAPLVAHVHLSEPGMRALGEGGAGADYAALAAQLRRWLPSQTLTIEMLPAGDRLEALRRSVAFATRCYRAPEAAS